MTAAPTRTTLDVVDPTVAIILQPLVDGIRNVLGTDLVGCYLYGSAVTGGFDPWVSDLDLAVITEPEVEDLDLSGLDGIHHALTLRHPEWLDRLEVVYVGRKSLTEFRTSPGHLAVISPGEAFHVTGPVSDWLQNWYMVRETGTAVFGPPADSVIPLVSRVEFVAGVVAYAAYLRDRTLEDAGPGAIAYSLLSMCRALRTVRTGGPCSKQEAAAWVKERMPEEASLIDAALACRLARGRHGFENAAERTAASRLIERLADEIHVTPDHVTG